MDETGPTPADRGPADPTLEEVELDHVDQCLLDGIIDEVPEIDPAVEGIVNRIIGLDKRLQRMMEETLAGWDLTHGEWRLLGTLRKSGPPYRSSPGRLAQRLELSSGAMTNRIDQLERAGLVRRLPDPDDRRSLQVELTEKGLEVYRESVGAQAVKEALLATALDEDEKEELNRLLRRLMLAFERRAHEAISVPVPHS
jgi:DNA-binding MarR family transcriptional regulator